MLITTVKDFKEDTRKYLEEVEKNNETLIIKRGEHNGVVVISLEEYKYMRAIHDQVSQPQINRYDPSVRNFKKGSFFFKNLSEE